MREVDLVAKNSKVTSPDGVVAAGITIKDKKTKKYSQIGRSVPHIDSVQKVTGQLKYAGDIQMSQMLHVRVLRSPYTHARIVKIDTSQAEALPGVCAVITHDGARLDV